MEPVHDEFQEKSPGGPAEARHLTASLHSKDHKAKIDFQKIFIAVVNWPNLELYGAILSVQHASLASLLQPNSPMFS